MMQLISRIIKKAGWLIEAAVWPFVLPFCRIKFRSKNENRITIGITTFKDRYNICFRPLLEKIMVLFPGDQIIVIANGDVNIKAQEAYLAEIEQYIQKFRNVRLVSFTEPKGLSFMWNTIIELSENSRTLILNDDLKLKMSFRRFVYGSGFAGSEIATINSSWSHFLISKNIVEKIGWFDEGLTEIGGEDDDYLARLAVAGKVIDNFTTAAIARNNSQKGKSLKINSYGKDMSEQKGGYSTADTLYIQSKWEVSNEPIPGGVMVPQRNNTYWKIRPEYQSKKTRGQNC